MKRGLRVPAKTFLIGEYLALRGGPAVVLGTQPAFEFVWGLNNLGAAGFHPDSPAGKWLSGSGLSAGLSGGRIGFGSSTAEFLGAWIATRSKGLSREASHRWIQAIEGDFEGRVSVTWPDRDSDSPAGWLELLADYRKVAPRASGADLLAQAVGGVAIWDERSAVLQRLPWRSREIKFSIFATGQKLPTHEHLQSLDLDRVESLRPWAEDAVAGLEAGDADRLVASIRGCAGELEALGLVADATKEHLRALDEIPGVRAAKGCGALGADAVIVLHDAEVDEELRRLALFRGLEFVANEQDLLESNLEFET